MKTSLKYRPPPWSHRHRMEMCEYVANYEGCEIGDAILLFTHAAHACFGLEDEHKEGLNALDSAERMCLTYIDWWDDEGGDDFSGEVYNHFHEVRSIHQRGGAQ